MREIFAAAGQAAWPHILPQEHLVNLNPPERWREAITDPGQRVLIAAERTPIAFVVLRHSGDDDAQPATGEVDAFYSHPEFWGKGAGRLLLSLAEPELAEMGFAEATLWTAEENHRPRRIYDAAGWKLDGRSRERTLGGRSFVELRYRKTLPTSVH